MLNNNRIDWSQFHNLFNIFIYTSNTNIKLNSKKNIISAIKYFNILVQNTTWQLTLLYENKENKLKINFEKKLENLKRSDYGWRNKCSFLEIWMYCKKF